MPEDINTEMTKLLNSIVEHSDKIKWDDLVKASKLVRTLENHGGKLNRTRIMQLLRIKAKDLDRRIRILEKHKITKTVTVKTHGRPFKYIVLMRE